ncbi:hypothetical protein B0H63DRAFT_489181 [Podospora didyma]|uniref:Uncharacterized protein n=1 Tax=Podospora didyma TaxID=330526 RepID=A0AAE0N3E8_9PEZI|nr:hypothetical protein B0H63DRAFT_489181 [Podospora didyma]
MLMSDFSTSTTSTDNPRRCRVLGCRRSHVYATIGSQRVYSQFCIDHTCFKILPDTKAYHCPHPKLKEQKYCLSHRECGARGCREEGENDDDVLPWFCKAHRCTSSGCLEGIDNFLQKRCAKHTHCAAPHCTSPPAAHLHSTFCARHTCSSGACPNQARENKKNTSKQFCGDHECAVGGCGSERDSYGDFCSMHRCTLDNCLKPIVDLDRADSLFCFDHACKVAKCLRCCKKPSDYCDDHRCRKPSCPNLGANGVGSLCTAHRCRVADCEREGNMDRGFCASKHACIVPLCPKPRITDRIPTTGEMAERCIEHHLAWERAMVRRAVSEELTAEFEQERTEWRKDKKRLSDDINELRKRDQEKKEKEQHLRVDRDADRKRRASNEGHPSPDRLYPEYRGGWYNRGD